MSKLYIELYLDENVDVLVAKILRARGFNVKTVDEVGRKGLSDSEQLKYAVENGFGIASISNGWRQNISTWVRIIAEFSSSLTIRRRQSHSD